MPRKKPAIDYKQLPFEVHYKRIDAIDFEFMYPADDPPKSWKGYSILSKTYVREFGVTFSCTDPSGGRLAHVLGGFLDEFIPTWLEHVDSEESDARGGELLHFSVHGEAVRLEGDVEEYDYDDLEGSGSGTSFYEASNFKPDFLVLDADGDRLVVDCEGYMLAEDGGRIGSRPVVELTPAEKEESACVNSDWITVEAELYAALRPRAKRI